MTFDNLKIKGWLVVHYPNGEMEQLSILFHSDERQEALDYFNRQKSRIKVDLIAFIDTNDELKEEKQ